MHNITFIILVLSAVLSGCQGAHSNAFDRESAVDNQLSQPQLSSSSQSTDPGQPQKGFEQEVGDRSNII